MNLNFITVVQIYHSIKHLKGYLLKDIYSTNDYDIIFHFIDQKDNYFFIKFYFHPQLSLIFFPENSGKPKSKYKTYFKQILSEEIVDIIQHPNDRIITISLQDNQEIHLKLYGNKSNIIFQNPKHTIVYNSNLKDDLKFNYPPIIPTNELINKSTLELNKTYPFIDTELTSYLDHQDWNQKSLKQREIIWSNLYIEPINKWTINKKNGLYYQTLKTENSQPQYCTFKEVLKEVYFHNIVHFQFYKLYNQTEKKIKQKISQIENYIKKTKIELTKFETENDPKNIGDILMANQYQIKEKTKSVELFDFYQNKNIYIKLKDKLSIIENAEWYYKKSKNKKKQIEVLNQTISKKNELLTTYKNQYQKLITITDLKELNKFLQKGSTFDEKSNNNIETQIPFKKISILDFVIYIGKNAQSNDLMIQKHSFKDDLWLHAKDVSGSHVLIKYQSNKKFSNEIIQIAGAFAAYYSKRKTEPNCPVIVTEKKYVRKVKGSAPGSVKVEKEQVIFVHPQSIETILNKY